MPFITPHSSKTVAIKLKAYEFFFSLKFRPKTEGISRNADFLYESSVIDLKINLSILPQIRKHIDE